MFTKSVLSIFSVVLFNFYPLALSEPTWTSLRVTYGINIFSSSNFAKVPRRESKARAEGYTKITGDCKDGKFLGSRYKKGNDPTVVAIYDINGYIAGLQHGIPKADVNRVSPSYNYSQSSAYQLDSVKGQDIYFLTSYFVDPAIICEGGRSSGDYEKDGTGTGLYFQNGTNPSKDIVHIPLYEQEMKYNFTRWVRGECKRGMGVHYWYDYSKNMNCGNFFPFAPIYNRGKITSFAFLNFGNFAFSEKFEHPSKSTLKEYMTDPVPKCLEKEYDISGGISMMHVFFSVRPWNILC